MPKCKNCATEFIITDDDRKFYDKMDVTEPTWCPRCRAIRRMTWRNSRKIYSRQCDMCGKPMISIFSSDKPYTVYCKECWWGDNWDELASGRDFDFSRTFNEQFKELILATPQLAVNNQGDVNSEYTNFGYRNSNCYLCFGSDLNEECYYCTNSVKNQNSFDLVQGQEMELSSWCVDCFGSYNTHYCQESEKLRDCYFCYDCKNCSNCFGVAGLRNKEYYFFGKKLSPEEWEKKVREKLDNNSIKDLYKEVGEIWNQVPRRENVIIKSEGCTGDHLRNCSDAVECFDCKEIENGKYCILTIPKSKDIMDVYGTGAQAELEYEMIGGYGYNIRFTSLSYESAFNITYGFVIPGCKDCFGCNSMKKQQYCILNKKYSKEEYEKLCAKIIEHMKKTGEWGEFFNSATSPFGYNESEADIFFPLTKEKALAVGHNWHDETENTATRGDTKKNIFVCSTCNKNFKLVRQEISFLEKQGLPKPEDCYECRFKFLLSLRTAYDLWDRKCDKCGKDIKTAYAPGRPEKIYCAECYQKEIY